MQVNLTSTSHRIYYDEFIEDIEPVLVKVMSHKYTRPLSMCNFDRIHGLGFLYKTIRNLIYLSNHQSVYPRSDSTIGPTDLEGGYFDQYIPVPSQLPLVLLGTKRHSSDGSVGRKRTRFESQSSFGSFDKYSTGEESVWNSQASASTVPEEIEVLLKSPDTYHEILQSFHIDNLPKLLLLQFLERINKYLTYQIEVYIATSYFLYKLFYHRQNLTEHNAHKLVLTFIRISEKLIQDKVTKNEEFCSVCGWNLANKKNRLLEINGMKLLNFDLYISEPILTDHLQVIKNLNMEVEALKYKLHARLWHHPLADSNIQSTTQNKKK